MNARVKICGLTRPEDVEAAIEYGAHALGFIVEARSPRRLSVAQAAKLSRPAFDLAMRVAVTVNPEDQLIDEIYTHMRPDMLQLHGDETPREIRYIKSYAPLPIIKAVSIRTSADLETIKSYEGLADYILLDAKPPKGTAVRGGHGTAFDWKLLRGMKTKTPLILAGGLKADNIKAAQATGIKFFDLSSGVERSPGVKDPLKIKALMDALKDDLS